MGEEVALEGTAAGPGDSDEEIVVGESTASEPAVPAGQQSEPGVAAEEASSLPVASPGPAGGDAAEASPESSELPGPAVGADVPPGPAPSPPPDPIAEAPEMIWYVRPPTGGQFGPAAGNIMQTWLAEGRVSPDSLVWREGWRDWQEAGTVFPQLRAAQPMSFLGTSSAAAGAAGRPLPPRRAKLRRRLNGNWLTIILVFGVVAVILLGVFLYVLFLQ